MPRIEQQAKKLILAFLSPMKPCPKLHHSLPLNVMGTLLFFLQVYVLPLPDFQLHGDSVSLLLHPALAGWAHWQSLQNLAGVNCWTSSHVTLFPTNPLRTTHHCCVSLCLSQVICISRVPTWFFLFPSFCLSCSSTWRPMAWVCQEDKFITGEKCPPFKEGCSTSDDSRWRKGVLNSTSWVCYQGISLLGWKGRESRKSLCQMGKFG